MPTAGGSGMKSKSWMLVACLAIGNAGAQSTGTAVEAQPAANTAVDASATAVPSCRALCAGQVIELEIADLLRSDRQHNGDRFALRLAAPLAIDGVEVVPVGTPGVGEIVHASPSRAGGRPGELLLAARHLDINGRSLPLRGLKLGGHGKDQANASLAVSLVTGPFGLFVHGGEIEIPPGTRVQAKLAQDVVPAIGVAVGEPTPPSISPHPSEPTNKE